MLAFEQLNVPIRIGVLSDTHRSSRNPRALPAVMLKAFEGCDLILHAGDVNAPWVLRELERIAPVRAVVGNNEELPLRNDLPLELFFQAGDLLIGLMHGHHPSLTAREHTFQRMHGVVDLAIYGHSHVPEYIERDGLLMLNPGSPTQKRYQPQHTFAMVSVNSGLDVALLTLEG